MRGLLRAGAYLVAGYTVAKFIYDMGYSNGKWDAKGE
ncbi:hypothetical protein [Streptomyces phage Psst1]|nr:hypothetical protein [Streptomyces phage Psst1]WPJ30667.1 hypothetical protein [Streptomyces phage Psst2]